MLHFSPCGWDLESENLGSSPSPGTHLTGSFSSSCFVLWKEFCSSFFLPPLYPSCFGHLFYTSDSSELADVHLEHIQYHIVSYPQSQISSSQLVISIAMFYQNFKLSKSQVSYHYSLIYNNRQPGSKRQLSCTYSLSFQVIILPSNKPRWPHTPFALS